MNIGYGKASKKYASTDILDRRILTTNGGEVHYVHDEASDDIILKGGHCITDLYWHRVDGPSRIYMDGSVSWYHHDHCYLFVTEFCDACGFDEETKCCWVLKYGCILPKHVDQL